MREFNSDRPDISTGPFTIDAGHYQAEASFFEYTHDETDGFTETYSVLPAELRVGLLNNIEFDVLLQPYLHQHSFAAGSGRTLDGFGDLVLQSKINFWGNDGGTTSFGIVPLIELPTAQDHLGPQHVQGGVRLPLGVKLPADFDLTVMAEVDFVRDDADKTWQTGLLHTISVEHSIVGNLSAFVEYAGNAQTHSTYEALMDAGLTYELSDDVQLDAAISVGLSDSANDFGFLMGITFRI